MKNLANKLKKMINWSLVRTDIITIMPVAIGLLVFLTMLYLIMGSNCIFKCVTGLPCPGCGLTRASLSLISFQWGKVLYYNAFIFPIALLSILGIVNRYIRNKSNQKLTKWIILTGVCMIFYYIYRMYMYFPEQVPMNYHTHNLTRILFVEFGK